MPDWLVVFRCCVPYSLALKFFYNVSHMIGRDSRRSGIVHWLGIHSSVLYKNKGVILFVNPNFFYGPVLLWDFCWNTWHFQTLFVHLSPKSRQLVSTELSESELSFVLMYLAKIQTLLTIEVNVNFLIRTMQFLQLEDVSLIICTTAWLLQNKYILLFLNLLDHTASDTTTAKSSRYSILGFFCKNWLDQRPWIQLLPQTPPKPIFPEASVIQFNSWVAKTTV